LPLFIIYIVIDHRAEVLNDLPALFIMRFIGAGAHDGIMPGFKTGLEFRMGNDKKVVIADPAQDTFPGLPRPRERVLIAIAPDAARFRELVGPNAPEWGAAIAMPDERRIVMQGSGAGSDAGDPRVVLRHELAHLAESRASYELAVATSLALGDRTLAGLASLYLARVLGDAGELGAAEQALADLSGETPPPA